MITGFRIFLQLGCKGLAIPFSVPPHNGVVFGANVNDPSVNAGSGSYRNVIQSHLQDSPPPLVPPPPAPDVYDNRYFSQKIMNEDSGSYEWYYEDSNTFYNTPPQFYGWGEITDTILAYDKIDRIESLLQPQSAPTLFGTGTELNEGDNLVLYPDAWGVDILILQRGPGVNNWYGLDDTGNFGWVTERYDGQHNGKLTFINFMQFRHIANQG